MGNSKNIKNCKNCAHFIQHFSILEGTLNETAYGHCMCFHNKEKKVMVVNTDVCKSWVFMREPKEIGLKRIEYIMYFMAQQLEELSDELGEVRKKRK